MGSDPTELELSVESTSFVNRVNDQVRKRQKIISNVAGEGEEHSIIRGMFMAVTMDSATFMVKNLQDNQNSIVNTTDLTLKQMFGLSVKLVGEQDEISNLETIRWEKHSWKYLSLIGDERVINLPRAIITDKSHRDYDGISESRPNSSGTFSQDSPRCSSMVKAQIY